MECPETEMKRFSARYTDSTLAKALQFIIKVVLLHKHTYQTVWWVVPHKNTSFNRSE
jgi:hypothetical protein